MKNLSSQTGAVSDGPRSYFDRRTSLALKGLALVMMILHHFFTFPEWYLEGISYPSLAALAQTMREPLRICVFVFAFLTGYFYAFQKRPTWSYSFKKILQFLLSYWAVYLPLLLVAVYYGFDPGGVRNVVLEMLGVHRPIMVFCWYVSFYIGTMLFLPLYARLAKAHPAGAVLFGVFLPVIFLTVSANMTASPELSAALVDLVYNFPCVAVGYIFGRYGLFTRWFDPLLKDPISPRWKQILLWLALGSLAAMFRHGAALMEMGSVRVRGNWVPLYLSLDIFYAPVFVYCAANLIRLVPGKLLAPLGSIGKYSIYIWFIHCVFFNYTKTVFQPILFLPGNALLVLVWGLALCYIPARLIHIPVKALSGLIDRLWAKLEKQKVT